jgi:hypothetical protein
MMVSSASEVRVWQDETDVTINLGLNLGRVVRRMATSDFPIYLRFSIS